MEKYLFTRDWLAAEVQLSWSSGLMQNTQLFPLTRLFFPKADDDQMIPEAAC